jgi:Lysyl oxidase
MRERSFTGSRGCQPSYWEGVTRRVLILRLLPGFALLAATATVALAGAGSGGSGRLLLPDAEQVPPRLFQTREDDGRFYLGFESAVENQGKGPLLIEANRRESEDPEMSATQVLRRSGSGTRRVPGVGSVRFVESETHRHWHLLRFDTYELRRASDTALLAPDQKTGFCLGDRYNAGAPGSPPLTGSCGLDRPDLEAISMGISVGWGDDYRPHLEGQEFEITGFPAGRYIVVNRVNADGRLREANPRNNEASALVRVEWPNGLSRAPTVETLKRCRDTWLCGAESPPPLSRRGALARVRAAIGRELGRPSDLTRSCERAAPTRWSCIASWRRARFEFSAAGSVENRLARDRLVRAYRFDVVRMDRRSGTSRELRIERP